MSNICKEMKKRFDVIVKNDRTYYKHHERRKWDDASPGEIEEGSTCFLTPREIALNGLLQLEELEHRNAAHDKAVNRTIELLSLCKAFHWGEFDDDGTKRISAAIAAVRKFHPEDE